MAPVAPDVQNNNTAPLLFFGSQATLVASSLASVAYFLFFAHRSLPPSKHTRSKLHIEHRRLVLFIALALLSSFITLFCKASWLISSYRHWSYEHDIQVPNTLWESGYSKILGHSGLPLGLWYQDTHILKTFYYGILENPSIFGVISQLLLGMTPWSLFVGIEGHHRNIPWPFLLGFVLVGQFVGLSSAMNLFFAAMVLTPIPILSAEHSATIPLIPSKTTLLIPSLLSMAWVVIIPTFVDFAAWPMICYSGFIAVPMFLAVLPKISARLRMSRMIDMSTARSNYMSVYRIIAILAFVIHVAEFIGIFSKSVPPRHSSKFNYLRMTRSRFELSRWDQFQVAVEKIVGSLSDDPMFAATIWDILLAGTTLSVWALLRNTQVSSIFNCLGLPNWHPREPLDTSTSSSETSAEPETPTRKRGRGRPKKDSTAGQTETPKAAGEDAADGAYLPSSTVRAQVQAQEPLVLSDHDGEQSSEAGAITWVLFCFGGLGTALSAILGAELSGG